MTTSKNKQQLLLLQLTLIADVGANTICNLIEKLGTEQLLALYQMSQYEISQLGISPIKAAKIWSGLRDFQKLDRELDLIAKFQVFWTTILDSDYPKLLKNIPGAPAVLYWRGNLAKWPTRALAIVGSRQATSYANRVIEQIVPSLVQSGYAIVSGGALGVDTMAHQATLANHGETIVVCGTGLKHAYPMQNQRLFDQIAAANGAIVSSFNMETTGLPGNFPARNRIISGLSNGCLVVQAASQSGAKITAQFALEQGRELFVVPGLFGDLLSAGCHELAQQGAKVINSVTDIFSDLQPERKTILYQPLVPSTNLVKTSCDISNLIINLCSSAVSQDTLADQLNLELSELQTRLFDLQLQGQIRQNFAGLWEKG